MSAPDLWLPSLPSQWSQLRLLRRASCPWGPCCSWPAASSLLLSASTTITKWAGNPRKCSGLGPAWAWTWARAAGDDTVHGSQAGLQAGGVPAPSFPPRHSMESAWISWDSRSDKPGCGLCTPPLTPYRDNSLPCLSWPLDSNRHSLEKSFGVWAESRLVPLPGSPF